MTEGKTLKELDVKPGDVVEAVAWGYNEPFDGSYDARYEGVHWTVHAKHPKGYCGMCAVYDGGYTRYDERMLFRIISRASDQPKLWRDMTAEEKGALLLAHHEGKVIEWTDSLNMHWSVLHQLGWLNEIYYRIRPEPKRWTVDLMADFTAVGRIDLVDGKPDYSSVKLGAGLQWT